MLSYLLYMIMNFNEKGDLRNLIRKARRSLGEVGSYFFLSFHLSIYLYSCCHVMGAHGGIVGKVNILFFIKVGLSWPGCPIGAYQILGVGAGCRPSPWLVSLWSGSLHIFGLI